VQYVGFTAKAVVREYSSLVRESSIDEITFTILNEAFASHRLSFQNGPDICSLKLHRELADSSSNPLKTHYRISEAELDAYRESHPSGAPKGLYPRKAAEDSYRHTCAFA
jgi:hypothetical protein